MVAAARREEDEIVMDFDSGKWHCEGVLIYSDVNDGLMHI